MVRTSVAPREGLWRACRNPVRTPLLKLSAGSGTTGLLGGRHQRSAATTPTLLTAFTQNGAPSPTETTKRPPSAGPTARLILMPTLFAATADGNSALGTN